MTKVYLAVEGTEYEGFNVLGVYMELEDAYDRIENMTTAYCDYIEIQVFELNGDRLWNDPEEFFKKF
jgi:hypothetical protein